MQYEFREHFRNSILSNHHASFNVHWTKARSKQFGHDCPKNVTSFHDIFMDRIRKNHYYWKSRKELWWMRLIISLKGLLKDPYFQSLMSKKRCYLKNVFWMIDLEIRVKVTVDIIICLDTFNDYITKISLAKNSQLNQNEKTL